MAVLDIIVYILLAIVGLIMLGAVAWYLIYTPIKQTQRQKDLVELSNSLLYQGPVDLERYSGEWYEVARLPNNFQVGCLRSKATYTPSASVFDEIIVLNECLKGDGSTEQVIGRARSLNENNTALAVSFAPRWLGNGTDGDYWILDIDQEYKYVIVGSPDRKYLWFLARDSTIPPDEFTRMSSIASEKGYDVSKLLMPSV